MVTIVKVQMALFVFLFFNCNGQQVRNANLEEAIKAIAASNELYFEAFARGDSSFFIDRYAADCWIMRPNAPTLCGVEAPLDFFKTKYKSGLRNGKLITIDVFGDGVEFVTEEGFWQFFNRKNKMIDSGKYLVLWKKTADGWKMFRNSFSSDYNK